MSGELHRSRRQDLQTKTSFVLMRFGFASRHPTV